MNKLEATLLCGVLLLSLAGCATREVFAKGGQTTTQCAVNLQANSASSSNVGWTLNFPRDTP